MQPTTAGSALDPRRVEAFASKLFAAKGMDLDKAQTLGRLLVLSDMMGRTTHGLAMALAYLIEIDKGTMHIHGEPLIVKDHGVTQVWDGQYLPGLWLVERAIQSAMPRAKASGVAIVSIRRSHHIGCLAALTKQAADQGFIALIANSDPAGKRVAPYGGREALFTPNPLAFGYPGRTHPVLVDMCASITTTSMTRDKVAHGEHFKHEWLLDAEGLPTTDPAVLEHRAARGSLQLIGGQEYGHKGFGLAVMIEALSQGLSGHGRRDEPTRWGGNVFLQVMCADMFAGNEAFMDQTDFFAQRCRDNAPIHAEHPVRLPGDQAAKNIARAERDGITYEPTTWQSLCERGEALKVLY
jgi:LDH2 family malate/lactate/ureidoglycolate dehydrogenase